MNPGHISSRQGKKKNLADRRMPRRGKKERGGKKIVTDSTDRIGKLIERDGGQLEPTSLAETCRLVYETGLKSNSEKRNPL